MTAVPPQSRLDPGILGITRENLPPLSVGGVGPTAATLINLRQWFDADRRSLPLELEIGSGKGAFLVQQAQAVPNVNYIGLEYAAAYWRYAADRCRRHGLTNVRLVRIEAGLFLRNYVADAIFQQIHIYFPDPWPKKRHHKRRLIQAPLLTELHRVLSPLNGQKPHPAIRLATDHADYFQWMQDEANKVADLFEILPFESPDAAREGELVGTNFERKYRREGRPFYAMILAKK